jgi:hypothetical protein
VESSGQTAFATSTSEVIGADEDANYRTVSVLALVSLILGLAAPLCFVAPLLYVVPIAGAAVSLLAIGRIAASGGALIGRKAAVIALALCVASASAAWARGSLTNRLLSRQARQAALEWFALLGDGETQKAFDLTVASTQSPPPPPPVNSPEANAEPAPDPFQQFCDNPVVKFLLAVGPAADVRYVQDLGFDSGLRGDCRFRQEYTVSGSEQSSSQSGATVQLTMQRTRQDGLTPTRWLVSEFQSDEISPPAEGE